MLEILIVAAVVGTTWYLRSSQRRTPSPVRKPARKLPTRYIFLGVLFWYWPELLRFASDWFVTTPTGVKSELTIEQIIANRWWIDVAFVGIAILLARRLWAKKPKGPTEFRATPLIQDVVALIVIGTIGVAVLGLIVSATMGVSVATGWDDKILAATGNKAAAARLSVNPACTEEQGSVDVFPEGVGSIVFCPNTEEKIYFPPVSGRWAMQYDFDREFKEKVAIPRGLKVEDYVILLEPVKSMYENKPYYRLALRQSAPGYVSGWERTHDIKEVPIFIRAVPL